MPEFGKADASQVGYEDAIKFFKNYTARMQKEAALIRGRFKAIRTMWDIGANIGWFSKCYLETIPKKLDGAPIPQVHLFEPIPRLHEISKKVLEPFGSKVHFHNTGLSDKTRKAEIAVWHHHIGGNTLETSVATPKDHKLEIQLSHWQDIPDLPVPDFIKLDVEGHESFVLDSLMPLLEEHKVPIMIELGLMSEFGLSEAVEREQAKIDEVLALGYKCTTMEGKPLKHRSIRGVTNCLLWRGDGRGLR